MKKSYKIIFFLIAILLASKSEAMERVKKIKQCQNHLIETKGIFSSLENSENTTSKEEKSNSYFSPFLNSDF